MSALTAEKLRDLLDYNPDTGVFTRRVKTSWRTTVGEAVGYPTDQGYIRMRVNVRTYKAHRLAWLHFYGGLFSDIDDAISAAKALRVKLHGEFACDGDNK